MEKKKYYCKRCGFNSDYKHVLRRHIEKKSKCPAKYNKMNKRELILDFENNQEVNNDFKFKCKKCNKLYVYKISRDAHEIKCNNLRNIQQRNAIISETLFTPKLNEENVEKLKRMNFDIEDIIINNTTLNDNSKNIVINNNYTIYNTFDPKINHIKDKKKYYNCLYGMINKIYNENADNLEITINILKSILIYIYYNKYYPENQSIRLCEEDFVKNIKIYENENWLYEDKKYFILIFVFNYIYKFNYVYGFNNVKRFYDKKYFDEEIKLNMLYNNIDNWSEFCDKILYALQKQFEKHNIDTEHVLHRSKIKEISKFFIDNKYNKIQYGNYINTLCKYIIFFIDDFNKKHEDNKIEEIDLISFTSETSDNNDTLEIIELKKIQRREKVHKIYTYTNENDEFISPLII
jgi:hypothetical protein